MDNALEIHAHYSKLFEAFAALPPADIGAALFERACELWAERPWNEFGQFLDRVESYLEQSSLSPERRAKVVAFLSKQKPHYERGLWLPETRPRIIQHDEADLKRRLATGGIFPEFETVTPAERGQHLANVRAEIERRLSLLASQGCTPAAAQSTPAVALTPGERACVTPFTLDDAADLARLVGLTDASGTYCLGPKKLGAVVGFCLALKHAGKLRGAVEDLTAVVGPRLGVEVRTRKAITTIAKDYYSLTEKALTRLKQTS